ncbi:MAG: urease accessory protein UreF [Muribaculaceae bacterium]|nr:urease accessory protein UreF [Muribaculaceae bacterium]
MSDHRPAVMQLLQFTDSAFPVGTFSFSNGLETAAYEKIVRDRKSLQEFARSQAWQAAFTDGIAALHAFRAARKGDLRAVMLADSELMLSKMNDEARTMLTRMGKKLAELGARLFPEVSLIKEVLQKIENGSTPGMYPVMQGLVFATAGLDEKELFYSHQYGVINMVLSAALRCVRVSHYDTQEILFELSAETERLYDMVKDMRLDEMNAFFPELDILASLHEKGNQRMFMS